MKGAVTLADQLNQPSDPAQPALRAADTDRERVATLLREGFSEGRLSLEEFEERLERAYAARTLAELSALTRDLPQAVAGAAPAGTSGVAGRPDWHRARDRVLTYLVLMLFLVGIWAASGRHGSFWPIWPILIGAFILALDVLGLQRPGRSARREVRAAQRRERRDRRRERYRDSERPPSGGNST